MEKREGSGIEDEKKIGNGGGMERKGAEKIGERERMETREKMMKMGQKERRKQGME